MDLNSYLKKCLKNKEFKEYWEKDKEDLEKELSIT